MSRRIRALHRESGPRIRQWRDVYGFVRSWIVVCALLTAAASAAVAQESPVTPTGYTPDVQVAQGPSWEDFNALVARLQATEARLQSLSTYTSTTTELQQPRVPLAVETQTAPDTAELNSRVGALEQAAEAQKSRFPQMRLSGFFHYDTGFFGQDATSRATFGDIPNGSGFRRARLQGVGQITEFTRASIEMDFAFAGRPSFMDVWGEQTNVPILGNLRMGQYRQPITMDSWTNIKHLEFLERSTPFIALDPFRRVGAMSWFNSDDQRTMFAASVYGTGWTFWNGTNTSYNTEGNDNRFGTMIGNVGGISAATRLTHLLYYDPYAGDRYLLHVGGGYNFSDIGGSGTTGTFARTYQARAIPEFFVGDQAGGGLTAAGTPNFVDTGRFLANDYQLVHGELGGNYGSAHFQAEYIATFVDQRTGPQVFYDGAYFQCGYFLTGESCGYNKAMGALDYNVQPFREFIGLGRDKWFCGWGAWELAFRWSYLDLSSNKILAANLLPGTAGPPTSPNPGVLNDATIALNWWWNQFTRVQFNYINAMLNSDLHGRSDTSIYTARFQIEF